MRRWLALYFSFIATALPAAVRADDGFRCATGRLVSVGDRMNEVLDRCGTPDATFTRMERRGVRHRVSRRIGDIEESFIEERMIEVPIEEWTYDLGRNSFTRYVIFENGQVINVVTGNYGKK